MFLLLLATCRKKPSGGGSQWSEVDLSGSLHPYWLPKGKSLLVAEAGRWNGSACSLFRAGCPQEGTSICYQLCHLLAEVPHESLLSSIPLYECASICLTISQLLGSKHCSCWLRTFLVMCPNAQADCSRPPACTCGMCLWDLYLSTALPTLRITSHYDLVLLSFL